MRFLFNSPLWQLIAQSDWISRLVLLGLFAGSILCIAIIILKYRIFRHEKKVLMQIIPRLRFAKTVSDIESLASLADNSLAKSMLQTACEEIKVLPAQPTAEELERLNLALEQTVQQLLLEGEQYMPILGTSAAVGPLMGLFGTVWGLIHSFISISQEKTADIATVAPGIAEALITTLAGLVVAIPALIFFHYFANELRKIEFQLYTVIDKVLAIVKSPTTKQHLNSHIGKRVQGEL